MGDDKTGDINYVVPQDALLALLPKLLSTSREKGLLLLDRLMQSMSDGSELPLGNLDSARPMTRYSVPPTMTTQESDEDEDMTMAGGDEDLARET
jgi:hypothetical protein